MCMVILAAVTRDKTSLWSKIGWMLYALKALSALMTSRCASHFGCHLLLLLDIDVFLPPKYLDASTILQDLSVFPSRYLITFACWSRRLNPLKPLHALV